MPVSVRTLMKSRQMLCRWGHVAGGHLMPSRREPPGWLVQRRPLPKSEGVR
jgi:hypothetical protein